MSKQVKLCHTCWKYYTGYYCKNRDCPKNKAARKKNRERARGRAVSHRKLDVSVYLPIPEFKEEEQCETTSMELAQGI